MAKNQQELKNKIFNFLMAGGLLINVIVIALLIYYSLFK
tara:strand:+ start:4401 stop:4517 length:117 start_codon:yes stop_codon:yes gene_type:complete